MSVLMALVSLTLFAVGLEMSIYLVSWSYSLGWYGFMSTGVLCGILSLSFLIVTYFSLVEINERRGD